AAEHPEQARRAAERIKVAYEPLEPVVDPERATEQEPIHDGRPTAGHGFRDDARPNVVRTIVIRYGDPDAEAEVSVSGVYELGIQDQAFLGPESGLAIPDAEGGVDVYVATQWLHVDRDQVAPCLGLEPEQVRIHLAGVGGAFGGREDLLLNVLGTGGSLPPGQQITCSFPAAEVSRRAAELPIPEPEELPRDPLRLPGGSGNTTRGQGVKRGVGFAVGFKNVCYSEGFDASTAARVRLSDGAAEIHCAAAEVGQGVVGVILQTARTELELDDVVLVPAETAS